MSTAHLSEDGAILHIHIPMQLRRRGGRKVILTPDGRTADPPAASTPATPDDPVVLALVRARRWQGLLESGEVATIKELAEKEGVEKSYLAKLLKLNILAPAIVETILRGDYPDSISLEKLREGIPLDWEEQQELFGIRAA
ncbi:MAG: hypothetical protein HQL76_17910 [Magnetococcales bacterium]|nr:hypothetical protein [Magnetococcales bacterium]